MTRLPDLIERARRWATDDPDAQTAAALRAAAESQDLAELEHAVGTSLTFGTAGIRGRVGPGSARINQAVVIRTAGGLAAHLDARGLAGVVVVGHDARPDSPRFAADVAQVLAAAGREVMAFDGPTPTPVVAYAARVLDAAAAVVVTASHNPPADNGIKVYGPDAAQIVAPTDREIETLISAVGPANRVARDAGHVRISAVPSEVVDRYVREVLEGRLDLASDPGLKIVHTAMHGVGGALAVRLLSAAGYEVVPVAEQADPDGTFPTVRFPNPEEPGALHLALDLAAREGADLILANDPDADRLAVAVRSNDGFRVLTGDELGVLLADHLLGHASVHRPLLVTSLVSTPMAGSVAAAHGADFLRTYTGFKWIVRAQAWARSSWGSTPVLGFEEAIGYSVGETVRDKDGLSASVHVADLAAHLRLSGMTLVDRIEQLWAEHGVWVSHQVSVPVTDLAAMEAAVPRLALSPPAELAGLPVQEVVDHRLPVSEPDLHPGLPPDDVIELRLDTGRVLVRPSGTEPKVKLYVHLRAEGGGDVQSVATGLAATAATLAGELAARIEGL